MWHVLLRLHTNDCLMRCCLWACLLVSQLARFMKKISTEAALGEQTITGNIQTSALDMIGLFPWIIIYLLWITEGIQALHLRVMRPQQFKQKGLLSNRAWAPFVQSLCGARFPRFKDLMWIVICLSLLGCDRLATCPGCTPPKSAETGSSTLCNLSRTSI